MLQFVELEESTSQAVRRELACVLSSPAFSRNDRQSQFLRFLVERHLDGRDSELKESVIAIDVFGRKPDYDPKLDAIVRTEAVRLRARLNKYYSTDGCQDPLVIELPKGGYVPRFRQPAAMCDVQGASPTRLWLAVVLAGVLVAATTMGVWSALHKNAPIAIAVLPLVNLSQEPGSEYFADGLTSEIIRDLSIIDGLTVRSQTSSFALKGTARSVGEVGRQLEADYLVEASVARNGQHVRINAQVVRVRDDVPLWSGKFDRDLTDILAVQEEISQGIVNSLRLKLGRGRRRYETSPEAYDLYLQARALDVRPFSPQVIDLFEKAIGKDSSLAPAYAGLAAGYAALSGTGGPNRTAELSKMQAAAERAIQLDPLLAEAHTALGAAYARHGKWDLAERSFRRAIELDRNLPFARQSFADFVLHPLGRIDEAVRELQAAERNDPLSSLAHVRVAGLLLQAGRYDEAIRLCEKLPASDSRKSFTMGRALLAQGRSADAIRFMEETTYWNVAVLDASTEPSWGYLAYAYAMAGRRTEAEKLMAEDPLRFPHRGYPYQFALAFAGFRDKDRTIELLERMAGVGPVRIGNVLNTPEFAFVQGDPRVKALRKHVGLPE